MMQPESSGTMNVKKEGRLIRIINALVSDDRNPAKRLNLLEPGETFRNIDIPSITFLSGLDAWWRATYLKDGRRWGLKAYGINDVKDFFKSFGELSSYAIDGLMFAGKMIINNRISNEFTQLEIKKGEAGALFDRARENYLIGDHSRFHNRRIELIKRMILMNVWFLRHGEEKVTEWLLAGDIYDANHDKDQVISQQRNFEAAKKLKTKSMHGEAGAVRIGVQSDLLEKAGDLSPQEAEKQLVAAMVMILVHPEPELMEKKLIASGRAAEFRAEPEKLYSAWIKGEINVFSLTRADVATILKIGKAKDGFVTKDTSFGLDPAFESIQGNKTRLKKFSQDDKMAFGEILGFSALNEERQQDSRFRSFVHMVHVEILADLIDMYSPALDSIFRKVLVPYSKVRPWFRMKGFGNLKNLKEVLVGEDKQGNIPADEDSDIRRALWEIVNTFRIFGNTRLGKSTYVSKELLPQIAKEALIALKQVSLSLMTGSLEAGDLAFFQKEESLTLKALRRGKLPPGVAKKIVRVGLTGNHQLDRLKILQGINQHCPDQTEDYLEAMKRLDEEKAEVLKALVGKPRKGRKKDLPVSLTTGLAVYPSNQTKHVIKLIDRTGDLLGIDIKGVFQLDFNVINPFRSFYPYAKTIPKVIHAGVVN